MRRPKLHVPLIVGSYQDRLGVPSFPTNHDNGRPSLFWLPSIFSPYTSCERKAPPWVYVVEALLVHILSRLIQVRLLRICELTVYCKLSDERLRGAL